MQSCRRAYDDADGTRWTVLWLVGGYGLMDRMHMVEWMNGWTEGGTGPDESVGDGEMGKHTQLVHDDDDDDGVYVMRVVVMLIVMWYYLCTKLRVRIRLR